MGQKEGYGSLFLMWTRRPKCKQHRTIVLSQPGYIKDIIEKYKPDKQYTTPHDNKLFNRPESEKSSNPVDITTYLSILMKLMF